MRITIHTLPWDHVLDAHAMLMAHESMITCIITRIADEAGFWVRSLTRSEETLFGGAMEKKVMAPSGPMPIGRILMIMVKVVGEDRGGTMIDLQVNPAAGLGRIVTDTLLHRSSSADEERFAQGAAALIARDSNIGITIGRS